MNSIEDYEIVSDSRQAWDRSFSEQSIIVVANSSFRAPDSSHVFRAELTTRDGAVIDFKIKCRVHTDFIRCPLYSNVAGGTANDVENLINYWKAFRGLEKGYFMLPTARCAHQEFTGNAVEAEECVCVCSSVAESVRGRCYGEEFLISKLEEL